MRPDPAVRSDPAARAGDSAAEGFVEARAAARRRRVLRAAVLAAGAAGVLVAPTWLWAGSVAAVAIVVALACRPDPDAARWQRGAAGEEATARLLEGLPTRRWVVLHDRAVSGSSANLDHIVIGPTGVWVVDTKAYRARLRSGWRSVHAGGSRIDTAPAAWEASVVADRLGVTVRAVLAVHGEGLGRGRTVDGVPVLPAGRLLRRLRRRRRSARLGRRDVVALAEACDRSFPPAARPARGRRRAGAGGGR